MTTQREPDTSAEGLRERRLELARVLDGFPFFPLTEVQAEALVAGSDALRALADAAGKAAPVPPPVEGLETTGFAIIDGVLDASDQFNETGDEHSRLIRDTLRQQAIEHFDRLTARANAEHDRAKGLAKEVERLKAKLAVYEAPIGDGEAEKAVQRLDNRAKACRLTHNDLMAEEFEGNAALIRRLSAAHAECKGENTKLRGALSFYRDQWVSKQAFKHMPGLEWKPTEALLDDCGNIAVAALAPRNETGGKEEKAT